MNDAYAATTMKFLFYTTTEASADGIESVEGSAETVWDAGSTTPLTNDGSTTTISSGTLYEITFDTDSWITPIQFKFASADYYAFFAEHALSEFANDAFPDYIKDEHGDDYPFEYIAGTTTSSDEEKKWGEMFAACLMVWLVVFSGIVFFAHPALSANPLGDMDKNLSQEEVVKNTEFYNKVEYYVKMFASGTLLGTTFSLILGESTHLISGSDEAMIFGKWSAMVLLGFLSSSITATFFTFLVVVCGVNVDYLVPISLNVKAIEAARRKKADDGGDYELTKTSRTDALSTDSEATPAATEEGKTGSVAAATADVELVMTPEEERKWKEYNFGILVPLIYGDFFHNFCDGVFIGAAFKLCDTSLAWTIAASTIAHEFPQEVADYAVLTKSLNFSTLYALLYNCLSGFSVILGGMIVTGVDIEDNSIGMLLAYGSGNFIYVATVELFARDHHSHDFTEHSDKKEEAPGDKLYRMWTGLLTFMVGVVAVSIILLNHEHCSAESTDDSSEDAHGHRLLTSLFY